MTLFVHCKSENVRLRFHSILKRREMHDHLGILFKMAQLHFDPIVSRLFQSFFANRMFWVELNHVLSEQGNASCRVPKGSILSSHLYRILIYYFPHIDTDPGILYADDSFTKVRHHLDNINQFYADWVIRINSSKTNAICIRNASEKCRKFVVPVN